MTKFLRLLFVTFLFLIPSVAVSASCNIIIDGETLICRDALGNTVEPFIENGTTYVPVRALSNAFNTPVEWDAATKTVFLGKKGGEPSLGDNVNIFYNGNEYICRDVNGEAVYPILLESTTYLPLRGIGELFGKNVSWDNFNKSAILTSTISEEEINYLTNSMSNTASVGELSQRIDFEGSLLYNGAVIQTSSLSEEAAYSSLSFSLDSILPENYERNTVYKGEGNYFIYADSSKFKQTSYIHASQINLESKMNFSPLYINVFVKNGYIRNISVETSYTLTSNQTQFIGKIKISSSLSYPPQFRFPNIPYPGKNSGDSVFSQDVNDATMISNMVENYVTYAVNCSSKEIVNMLSKAEYDLLFGKKTEKQRQVHFQNISKKLNSIFRYATGEYEVTDMSYINAESLSIKPEKAARIKIQIMCYDDSEKWKEEIEIMLIKLDSEWKLSAAVIEDLI